MITAEGIRRLASRVDDPLDARPLVDRVAGLIQEAVIEERADLFDAVRGVAGSAQSFTARVLELRAQLALVGGG